MYYYRIIPIFIIITITISIIPTIMAVEEPLSITTSSNLYNEGDVVVVFGKITAIVPGLPITIQIYYQDNLVDVAQIQVAQDGTFAQDFSAGGPFWSGEGTYIIRGYYTDDKIKETSFEYYKEAPDVSTLIFPVDIPNSGTFDVGYTIRGGEVKDITINKDLYSLFVELSTDSKGKIILKIPRESFDATNNDGADDIFIILIGNDRNNSENFVQVPFKEIETGSDFRTISINFEAGDKWIQIIGTHVIPEFGSIVIIILVVAIASTIIISKNKISILHN